MCNTPEELPMSAEAFERKYPGMVSAMEVAAHRALATAQASGKPLANVQCLFDLSEVAFDLPLVKGNACDRISQSNNSLVNVSPSCGKLCVVSGINRLSSHALTSFLTAGGIILASLAIVGNLKGKG
jgi:hypothetical protein